MKKLKLGRNDKINLIFYFSAIVLWLLTVATTRIDYLTPDDFLGTAGKLPLFFWLSLLLIVIGITNDKTENVAVSYFGLILLISILYVTYPIIEPDGRHGVSYYVTGISKQIVEGEYFSESYRITWLSFPYISYQGFPMFITIFTEITRVTIGSLVRFLPSFLIYIMSLVVFVLFHRVFNKKKTAFLAVVIFITLCTWNIFLVPQLLTYILLPIFLFLSYIEFENPDNRYIILLIVVLLAIIITHIIAPVVIILFLVMNIILNSFITKKSNITKLLLLLSIVLFVGYMIYIAKYFFNAAFTEVLSSFQSFDSLFDVLSSGDIDRPMGFERKIVAFALLTPLLISILLAVLFIITLFFNKKYKYYTIQISYLLGCLFLFLIPYGGDLNISRVAYFVIISSSFFLACLSERYPKFITTLIIIFALMNPIAYSGGGTKISVIPVSELIGIKSFAETADETANYFSQSGGSIVNYQNPYRAFKQKQFSLWNPPIRDFDIDWDFKYLIYSLRDHTILLYYLGYDPIYDNMAEINIKFNKVYENNNFMTYSRKGTS